MKTQKPGVLGVEGLLLRASLGFLLLCLGASARAQDVNVTCGQAAVCPLTPAGGIPWVLGNKTWTFRPLSPNVTVYIYIHNLNTSNSHTQQTVSVFQSPFGRDLAPTFSQNSSRWVKDTITQNSQVNASCNSVTASNDLLTPPSGLGTCFVTTVFAAQVAINISGAITVAGSPDNFDLYIIQQPGSPGGGSPGSPSSVSTVLGPLQPPTIVNQEATSSANSSNVVALQAGGGTLNPQARVYLFSLAVRATSGSPVCSVTIVDSTAGANIWSSDANFVSTSTRTVTWPVPLTMQGIGGTFTITVSACGSGISSIIDVQSSTL